MKKTKREVMVRITVKTEGKTKTVIRSMGMGIINKAMGIINKAMGTSRK